MVSHAVDCLSLRTLAAREQVRRALELPLTFVQEYKREGLDFLVVVAFDRDNFLKAVEDEQVRAQLASGGRGGGGWGEEGGRGGRRMG